MLKIIKTSLDVLINRNMIFSLPEISYSTDKKKTGKEETNMYSNNKKSTAKEALQSYLEQVHGIDVNKPFICINPSHADRNPSMSFDRKNNRCVCFSCGARYDIFDIVGIDYGITNTGQKFKKTYQILGSKDWSDYNR